MTPTEPQPITAPSPSPEELTQQLDDANATLARVQSWAEEHRGQWNPETMNPKTFDQGVGAAAHDVFALVTNAPTMVQCRLCCGSGMVATGPWGVRPPRVTCPECGGARLLPDTHQYADATV